MLRHLNWRILLLAPACLLAAARPAAADDVVCGNGHGPVWGKNVEMGVVAGVRFLLSTTVANCVGDVQQVRVIVQNPTNQRLDVRFDVEFVSISGLREPGAPSARAAVAAGYVGTDPMQVWKAFADHHSVEPDASGLVREVILRHVMVCPSDPVGAPAAYQSMCSQPDETLRGAPDCPQAPANAQYGYTGLMLAARSRNVPLALQLVGCGEDVNIAARDGYTALMFAANARSRDIVEALLDAGANVNARQESGLTALGIVDDTFPEISNLLRAHGGRR